MKTMPLMLLLLHANLSLASLDQCFRDAQLHAQPIGAVTPDSSCEALIRQSHDRVEAFDIPEDIYVYGLKNIFYVRTKGQTTLSSGDQTQQVNCTFFRIHGPSRNIILFQRGAVSSVSLHKADFVGNVAPLHHLASPKLNDVSNVVLLPEQKELVLLSQSSKSVRFLNMNADSRYPDEPVRPKLKRSIQGPKTQLDNPETMTVSAKDGLFYVLDSERVLIFKSPLVGDISPVRVIPASGIRGYHVMELTEKEDEIKFKINGQVKKTLKLVKTTQGPGH